MSLRRIGSLSLARRILNVGNALVGAPGWKLC